MRALGRIVLLQVQVSSLKVGQSPRRYDPEPLHPVPRLRLSPEGVVGCHASDALLLDVHHGDHPTSKKRGGNGISIGFTAHYQAMREQFGDRVRDGLAGENILVETDRRIDVSELAGGLVIEGQDGRLLVLHSLVVAAPCVEFARYVLNVPDDARPDRTVTEALQFLHDGMRGYYASYTGDPAVVVVGDRVSVS